MSATPPGSGPRIVFTDNHDDPRSTVQYLHDLGMYRILAHHDLDYGRMHDLAELAAAVRATLWLIWSSPDTDAAHLAVKELTTAGHNVQRMWPNEVRAALPTPGHWWTADPVPLEIAVRATLPASIR